MATLPSRRSAADVPPTARASRAVEVSVVRDAAGAVRLEPEWRELWQRAGETNPFLQPGWLLSWARLHMRDGRLVLVALRRGADLVAVAPLHVWRFPGARALLPLGCGPGVELTEVPGILCVGDDGRRLRAALVRAVARESASWDWARVTLAADHGWLEPHWIPRDGPALTTLHHQTRACVVLDLMPSWQEQLGGLKRNVRESLRRSRNRLHRTGRPWRVRVERPGRGWPEAVATLARLHRMRAGARGRAGHPDWTSDPSIPALLLAAGRRLPDGALEIALLEIDGRPVAAQATLSGGGTTHLLMSGLDPAWWDVGAVTELVGDVVRRAIAAGERRLNFSSGPTVSKLRWSERLELHQDFVLVPPRARARLAYGLYASVAAVRQFRRAAGRAR